MILATIYPCWSSPIMVQFGTKGGPIIPPTPTSSTPSAAARSYYEAPAPVYEYQDDIPNTSTYAPIKPVQYRNKIYKYRPHPNLILGTPLDKKYILGYDKSGKYTNSYRKTRKTPLGLGYTGPQYFEQQEYEKQEYNKPRRLTMNYQQQQQPQVDTRYRSRNVPEIGVIYSSGARYYVPQIVYYGGYDDIDNSVYEANDIKYYQHKHKAY